YRLRSTPSWIGIAAVVLTLLACGALVQAPERAGPIAIAWLAVVVVLIAMGNRFRTFRCSDAECGVAIPREAPSCPGCGAGIASSAEEALERNTVGDDDLACSACEPEMPCPRHA
ncbi:MAG TPA: hypothetical protein VHK90_07460, partial [Thermoanaerobaculia bacterium]|nr:hypothetical protein [Thermoanaerobaculia bacterium]